MGQIKGSPGRRTASTKATDLSDAAKWDPWPEASKGMQTPTRHSQKAVAFTEHPHTTVVGCKYTATRNWERTACETSESWAIEEAATNVPIQNGVVRYLFGSSSNSER